MVLCDMCRRDVKRPWYYMDWKDLFFLLVVLWLCFWYWHDTAQCEGVVSDPVGWCNSSGACKVLYEQQGVMPFGLQGGFEKGFGEVVSEE